MSIAGVTFQLRLVTCGKSSCRKGCAAGRPSHGPYWYAIRWNPETGKSRTVYVGKEEPNLTTVERLVNK